MLKVVIDTNILIDGSEDFYNYPNRIIDLVISGQIQAFANAGTLRENRLLANRKIKDAGHLKRLEYFFDQVRPVETKIIHKVADDPEDDKILSSALEARADYLITSDHHLLKLEKIKHTRIVRPAEFWGRYQEGGNEGWSKWLRDFIH